MNSLLMKMEPFQLVYAPLPVMFGYTFGGFCFFDDEQKVYQILINDSLSEDEQLFSLKHEFGHIVYRHTGGFGNGDQMKENQADEFATNLTESEFEYCMSFAEFIKHADKREFAETIRKHAPEGMLQ